MTLSRHRKLTAAAAALLATVAATSAATGPASASPSTAAPGGRWTQLSAGPGINVSNVPGVTRWGRKQVVAWTQSTGGNVALMTRVVGDNALPAGGATTALTWSALSSDPAVFLLGGVPTVAFGGLRSLSSTDPSNGPVSYVQAADATSWVLGAGSLSKTTLAYSDTGIGAVDDGTGQPLVALGAGNPDRVTVHHGIDPTIPATAPDFSGDATGEAQNVSVARDRSTGAGYALWYSSSSNAFNGIHAQRVWPTLAPSQLAPLSSVSFGGTPTSVNPGNNVASAGRVGGGVWTAYGSGYPSRHQLVLWQVGTTKRLVLKRPGAIQYVGLSAAPGGRLWVWWVEGNAVFATRTNPSVTAAGVVRRVVAPGGASPTRTAGDGALGALDVVINAQPGSSPAIYSTRILEGLKVTVSRARVRAGGAVTVSVTDAGVPVRGATVRVGKATKQTTARGKATFRIAAGSASGRRTAVASATGYVAGRAGFRVR